MAVRTIGDMMEHVAQETVVAILTLLAERRKALKAAGWADYDIETIEEKTIEKL